MILWSVPPGVQAEGQKVFFTLEPGFTRIEYGDETLFLDYQNSRLFRFDIKTDNCTLFALSKPTDKASDTDLDALERRSRLFAEVEFIGEIGKTEVNGSLCFVKRLLFGPHVIRLLTVRTPVLGRYGQTFSPGFVDFLVHPDHDIFPQLKKIAEYNELFYRSNPLLRQMDLLGLLGQLGGVPLQQKSKNGVLSLQFKVLPEGEVRKSLPDSCQAPKQ